MWQNSSRCLIWFIKIFSLGIRYKSKNTFMNRTFFDNSRGFFRSFFGNVLTPLQLRVIDQVQLCTHTLELHNVVTAVKEFPTTNACLYGVIQELHGHNLDLLPSQVDWTVYMTCHVTGWQTSRGHKRWIFVDMFWLNFCGRILGEFSWTFFQK